MTQNQVHSANRGSNSTAVAADSLVTKMEDVGSRAADRFADLYAKTEHEGRSSRYDRAISKARTQ
jgi:hypothetical protein